MLSADHHNFFDTFGFLVFRQHFASTEIAEVSRQSMLRPLKELGFR